MKRGSSTAMLGNKSDGVKVGRSGQQVMGWQDVLRRTRPVRPQAMQELDVGSDRKICRGNSKPVAMLTKEEYRRPWEGIERERAV